MEQQLSARLNDARRSIRFKYDKIESASPDDPTRTVLSVEVEREVRVLRNCLSDDEVVQIQSRIDELRPNVVRFRPEVVDSRKASEHIFADAEDEYYFLIRLLE